MRKDIQTELNLLNSNKFSTKSITSRDNGKFAALEVNKNQGKKNADSGHMKKIQKLGSSLGGKIGGIITRDNGNLMIATKKANEANKQKYGIRIVFFAYSPIYYRPCPLYAFGLGECLL